MADGLSLPENSETTIWTQQYPQTQLDALRAESRKRALTPSEQAALLQFVQQVERQDLQRVEALAELAQKRGISVSALMDELGLGPDRTYLSIFSA